MEISKTTKVKSNQVDLKNYRVMIEGMSVQKPDGNKVYHPVHPSNIMILELELEDDERNDILERKG